MEEPHGLEVHVGGCYHQNMKSGHVSIWRIVIVVTRVTRIYKQRESSIVNGGAAGT